MWSPLHLVVGWVEGVAQGLLGAKQKKMSVDQKLRLAEKEALAAFMSRPEPPLPPPPWWREMCQVGEGVAGSEEEEEVTDDEMDDTKFEGKVGEGLVRVEIGHDAAVKREPKEERACIITRTTRSGFAMCVSGHATKEDALALEAAAEAAKGWKAVEAAERVAAREARKTATREARAFSELPKETAEESDACAKQATVSGRGLQVTGAQAWKEWVQSSITWAASSVDRAQGGQVSATLPGISTPKKRKQYNQQQKRDLVHVRAPGVAKTRGTTGEGDGVKRAKKMHTEPKPARAEGKDADAVGEDTRAKRERVLDYFSSAKKRSV